MPNKTTEGSRVLGIDPGYERMGVAIVEKDSKGKETLLFSGCFRTVKELPHSKRLVSLVEELETLLSDFAPNLLAIETLFFSGNQKTAMPVAEARGAVIASCAKAGMRVEEYTPLQIKVAVTGYGKADKKQIISMVPRLIAVPKRKMLDDEYDAIAVALTALASRNRMG